MQYDALRSTPTSNTNLLRRYELMFIEHIHTGYPIQCVVHTVCVTHTNNVREIGPKAKKNKSKRIHIPNSQKKSPLLS